MKMKRGLNCLNNPCESDRKGKFRLQIMKIFFWEQIPMFWHIQVGSGIASTKLFKNKTEEKLSVRAWISPIVQRNRTLKVPVRIIFRLYGDFQASLSNASRLEN